MRQNQAENVFSHLCVYQKGSIFPEPVTIQIKSERIHFLTEINDYFNSLLRKAKEMQALSLFSE